MAPAGVFSPVPGTGGRVALLSTARSTSPAFAAVSPPGPPRRMGIAAGGVFSSASALGGGAAGVPGPRFTSLHFAAPAYAMALRPRARLVPSAAKRSPEEVLDTPPLPPPRGFFTKLQEAVKLLKEELQRNALTLILLSISLAVAALSYWKPPLSGYAAFVIGICEKSEKVYKFLCHLVPFVTALWNFFK